MSALLSLSLADTLSSLGSWVNYWNMRMSEKSKKIKKKSKRFQEKIQKNPPTQASDRVNYRNMKMSDVVKILYMAKTSSPKWDQVLARRVPAWCSYSGCFIPKSETSWQNVPRDALSHHNLSHFPTTLIKINKDINKRTNKQINKQTIYPTFLPLPDHFNQHTTAFLPVRLQSRAVDCWHTSAHDIYLTCKKCGCAAWKHNFEKS